jgi:DUF4097 and DUF4098 domain-containing protein YvlB
MPEFPTGGPITTTISLHSGRLSIVAGDRAATVVEVTPADPAAAADVRAAEQTEVEFTAGRLLVKAPDPNWLAGAIGRAAAVDVRIELPSGSDVRVEVVRARRHTEGRLGEFRLDSVSGEVRLDQVGSFHASTVSGDITVSEVTGYADVNGVSGPLRLRVLRGSAVINGVSGDVSIGSAGSDLHVSTASGNIFVDDVGIGLTAKTSSGTIRLARLTRGQVDLATSSGQVDVGIGEGSAAWVDAKSVTGSVRNSLQVQDGPAEHTGMVNVRARTRFGDIMIHRAAPAEAPPAR